MPKHGEETAWNTRWCEGCGTYHGSLYPCEHYSIKLRMEIDEEIRRSQNIPSQRVEKFLNEIRGICRKHNLRLGASDYYTIVVENLHQGEEPISLDDVEDFTSF